MKCKLFLLALGVLTLVDLGPLARAQETEAFDLERDIRNRGERFTKLSLEEQLKLRAAQVKAEDDPAVKEALAKRNAAVKEFRDAMRTSMINADPAIAPLLDRIAGATKR